MGNGTHAAYPLGDLHRVEGVSPDENLLEAAEHVAAHVCRPDHPAVNVKLDGQVSFDAGNGVNDNL
jgi:hypothetical protein